MSPRRIRLSGIFVSVTLAAVLHSSGAGFVRVDNSGTLLDSARLASSSGEGALTMGSDVPSANAVRQIGPAFASRLSQTERSELRSSALFFPSAGGSTAVPDPPEEGLSLAGMRVFFPVPESSIWLTVAIAAATIFYGVCRCHPDLPTRRPSL